MKKDLKLKAKSPAVKRARKSAVKSTKSIGVGESNAAGASKVTSAKAKAAAVKTKASASKINATKAKPAEKPAVKSAVKVKKPVVEIAEIKEAGAKTGKPKINVQEKGGGAAGFRIGEPVVDPIGDVISGEARSYLGDAESQGRVEMDAYREKTEIAAVDGTLEDGPGMAAASGAGADADYDEAEEATSGAKRPPAKLERLQKILSQAGVASRRHAEEMIVAGRVMVNGKLVTQLGSKADAGRDHIRVDGKLLKGAERHRYFMLNKPKGYVTTVSDPEGRATVMEFFAKTSERLYPVGRLDYQSEGLLLMTNDGELANLLTKAGSGVEKVYLVKVAGQPSEEELERLRGGVTIEKGEAGSTRVRTAPARIKLVRVGENPWYEVVLTEGRNRELRKMFAAIGHFAEKIRRVEYGPIVLDVEPGNLRELTEPEVKALRLTAEGKFKPRRPKLDISLQKETGRVPGRGGKPFRKPDDRGQRAEWKPRERSSSGGREGGERAGGAGRSGERPRFDKRAGGPPRAGSGFGARPSRPFGARPAFGGGREGGGSRDQGTEGTRERGFERPRSERVGGPPRAGSGFGARPSRPFAAKPGFGARPAFGGGREGVAPRSGERKEWKPREQATGRFDRAAKKPFRPQGDRPFSKPGEGPAKRFDSGRDSGRRTGSKQRWVPRPGSARSEEGRGQTGSGDRPAAGVEKKRWEVRPATAAGAERAKPAFGALPDTGRTRPAFGARPSGFKRPDKPGGGSRGGSRFGGKRPGGR